VTQGDGGSDQQVSVHVTVDNIRMDLIEIGVDWSRLTQDRDQ